MHLPQFLKPFDPHLHESESLPYNALFPHKLLSHDAHSLWWPSAGSLKRVLIFIPGNPGLVQFYVPFLSTIHAKSDGSLAILAKSHVGHSPGSTVPIAECTLNHQIQSAIEALDAILDVFGAETEIVLVGHSVGAFVCMQMLKARPNIDVDRIFLLFPTISHIGSTPNGRKLSWLFRPPLASIVTKLSTLVPYLPTRLLPFLFRDWPSHQIAVLRSFLHSKQSIHAALTMAHHEMDEIKDLDAELLLTHRDKLWLYFAERDDWVGPQKTHILETFHPRIPLTRINLEDTGIPHAFCINHGEKLALQCHSWLIALKENVD